MNTDSWSVFERTLNHCTFIHSFISSLMRRWRHLGKPPVCEIADRDSRIVLQAAAVGQERMTCYRHA